MPIINKMKKSQWKKNLYEHSNYADNYTDKNFLNGLKTNVNSRNICYLEAINASLLVLQEICSTISIGVVFYHMYNRNLNTQHALIVTSFLTLICYGFYEIYWYQTHKLSFVFDNIKTVFVSLFFGYVFSPLFYTLTNSVSSDSIFNASTLLMLIHLIFFDYGASVPIVSNSLSTFASIFASICLASRLETDFDAFVLLTISITIFVLFPIFRKRFPHQFLLTLILLSVTFYFLWFISKKIIIIFTLLIIFTNIFCPIYYCKCQKFKENVYGPWDQAIVTKTNVFL